VAGHVNAQTQENGMKDKYLGGTSHVVPACGGLEEPFFFNGTRWLYVWDSSTKEHGYLNLDTDIIHDDYKPQPIPAQRIEPIEFNGGALPRGRRYVGKGVAA
jgi:hypothetical protein